MYNKKNLQFSIAGMFCLYLGCSPVFSQELNVSSFEQKAQVSNPNKPLILEDFSKLSLNQKIELYSNEKVTISYAKEIFKNDSLAVNQERINFYFENKTDQTLTLNFQKLVKYFNRNVSNDIKITSITLAPKQSLSNKDARFDARFFVFIKDLRGTMKAELEKVELKNITIL